MDKDDLIAVVSVTGGVIIAILLIAGIVIVADTKLTQYLYGGKILYCEEDYGAEFTATISDGFIDTCLYFGYSSTNGIKFKGTDGNLYACRGIIIMEEAQHAK